VDGSTKPGQLQRFMAWITARQGVVKSLKCFVAPLRRPRCWGLTAVLRQSDSGQAAVEPVYTDQCTRGADHRAGVDL
jgi:hypothetical protein